MLPDPEARRALLHAKYLSDARCRVASVVVGEDHVDRDRDDLAGTGSEPRLLGERGHPAAGDDEALGELGVGQALCVGPTDRPDILLVERRVGEGGLEAVAALGAFHGGTGQPVPAGDLADRSTGGDECFELVASGAGLATDRAELDARREQPGANPPRAHPKLGLRAAYPVLLGEPGGIWPGMRRRFGDRSAVPPLTR